MALIRPFGKQSPQIDDGAWIAENASIIGDVHIGPRSSIWYGAVLRGDVNFIRVGRESNIQDGSIVHVNGTPSHPTIIGDQVTVGHHANIHGCTLKNNCLIGIGAIILNGAVVGEGSLVAAGAVVCEGFEVPPGHLVAGIPAKVKRPLNEEEIEGLKRQAAHYWDDIASKYDA